MTEFSHIFLGFDEVGLFVLLFPFRVIQRFTRLLRLRKNVIPPSQNEFQFFTMIVNENHTCFGMERVPFLASNFSNINHFV